MKASIFPLFQKDAGKREDMMNKKALLQIRKSITWIFYTSKDF